MMKADSSRGYALSPEAKRINELESQIMGLHRCMILIEMHLRYKAGASVCADAIANELLVTSYEDKT
jgi:hypothetical protein